MRSKISMLWMVFISVFSLFIFFPNSKHAPEYVFNEFESTIIESENTRSNFSTFQFWEAENQEQGGQNSFVSIEYNKCIPVPQCKFEDCDIEGSNDGKGNYCLPVNYSDIGDWAPDLSINVFGVSLLDNPAVFTSPVEHTQASSRLPDKNNNAYFMFTNSQNNYGFIWVVEVQGIDPDEPEHISSSMPANVVWWQKLNKCHTLIQCKDEFNPGNFNHPARISHIDGVAAIAFQNWSFTVQGVFPLSRIYGALDAIKIPIPKHLQTSTLPKYPEIRSADAVAFYDVSNPRQPKFVRKLIGDDSALWGGQPPGRDISEVSIAKAGDYYHMNVGGTKYNFDGEGHNKLFFKNYQTTSLLSKQDISPMDGNIDANMFTNVNTVDDSHPVMVLLNTIPNYIKGKYSLTLQLITSNMFYTTVSKNTAGLEKDSVFLEKDQVFSTKFDVSNSNGRDKYQQRTDDHILDDLIWMSQACKRAWGFQMMDNGGYNVICHDINPQGTSVGSTGRFLVRGVSAKTKKLTRTNRKDKNDRFS